MVKLSKTSKLGTFSWSLQARETCPGAVDTNGVTVPACAGCYATTGYYHIPSVIKVRADNRTAWRDDSFVADMITALRHEKHMRLFDSGDFYHAELATKWLEIMQALPGVQFWVPTRSHKVARISLVLSKMEKLPNVAVRYSADSIDGGFDPELHGSVIYTEDGQLLDNLLQDGLIYKCPAYTETHGGKCLDCRKCYDKTTPVIAYKAHGNKMKGVVNKAKKVIMLKVQNDNAKQ